MADKQTSEFLEIPENIPLRWELFKGFGAIEIWRTLIVAAPFAIGAVLYAQFSTDPMRMLTALFTAILGAFAGVGLFVKQSYNLSIYDYFLFAWRFSHEQQQYDNISMEVIIFEEEESKESGSPALPEH